MSARLKLKNAKRMMDAMHAHCEEQIFKAKVKEAECHRLLFENIILGYPKADDTERRLVFKNTKISIGTGKPEWGAEPGKNYFVITWSE